ncbi:hypothetical protein EV702DRAFT_1050638 [Suillus placidus]|uniref:Uncharacterized protein n=1 Tax=Suillus placidus TaxID=48579 RepID=A0A9P6ZI29_9AGAM|nr:hypothetical protein EV702DRAFT_1050638 [Suillus placidus]
MSEDCCALNADGTLKDASDITFFNDPDDKVPLPQVASSAQPSSSTTSAKDAFSVLLKAGRTPATVAAGSRRSGRPSKPSARIRDADNACDEDIPSTPDLGESSAEFVPHPDDNDDEAKSGNGDDASQTTVSKSERTADLCTIFTRTSDGWVCNLCKYTDNGVRQGAL